MEYDLKGNRFNFGKLEQGADSTIAAPTLNIPPSPFQLNGLGTHVQELGV